MLPLAAGNGNTGMTVKIILLIFSPVIHQKIFFFGKQGQDIVLAKFKMRGQLDGQSRAGLFTEPAIDAAGEIDPEPGGLAPSVFSFGRLHGDAAYRADRRAQITGHTPFLAVRIPGQDDPGPGAGGQGRLYSGYCSVTGFRKRCLKMVQKPLANPGPSSRPYLEHPGISLAISFLM